MPNCENLTKLITALEGAKDEQFDIKHVFVDADGRWSERNTLGNCGTAACIAGWALHLAGCCEDEMDNARDWLDLSDDQVWTLFIPENFGLGCKQYPRLRAIDVLKHLRDTGEVDWDRFPAENYQTGTEP